MKKWMNTFWGVMLLSAAQIIFSQAIAGIKADQEWPVCEDDAETAECEQTDREYSFSSNSLAQGLSYLKKHPASLSIFLPKEFWYARLENNIIGYSLTESQFLDSIIEAQAVLVDWLRSGIAVGDQKPRVSWELLVEINRLVTGNNDYVGSEAYASYNLPVISRLAMKYVTINVVEEINREVSRLREAVEVEREKYWGYGVKVLTKRPPGSEFKLEIFPVSAKKMTSALNDRAAFLERYLNTDEGKEFADIKTKRGGYDTEGLTLTIMLDSARFYHMNKDLLEMTGAEWKTTPLEIPCSLLLAKMLDVPDQGGKTAVDESQSDDRCTRVWETLIPSDSQKDMIDFGGIYLFTATNFVERKAMFDMALSSLNERLQPVMTEAELVDVIAESWRQLALAHVFPDGNGRMLRLLMNSLLMAYGLAPLSCDPDCMPFSHTSTHFKDDIRAAMTLTRQPLAIKRYPEWFVKPVRSEWLERIEAL